MRNTVLTYIDRFRHDRHVRLVLGSVLLILAIVVSLTVYWQLRLSGIAMTNEVYCGYEEHTHTEECYESVLICGLEEIEGHTHNETCYDEEGNLICEIEECEPHTHSEECYEQTLICELEEHTHTVDCLVDLEADIETAVDWEATLPELTYDLRTDIVNIAYSQIGYTESTANYTLAEDGITHLGYTRYGAWYGGLYFGSEYSDWDSMFVAFCLDYAGIAEEFTYKSGAYAWSVELAELGYYRTADAYSPEVGDVAFIDTDLDGRADVTAIVVAVDETITVIQGNYSDAVALIEYPIGDSILGYANVTYTSEEETEEDEEITLDESDEVIAEEIEELDVSAEDFATLEFVGEDYIITVSYSEDAALPEGTELVAYEYAQDSENFLARYEEATELYGWEGSDETDPYHGFRLFNIGLYYDGTEIEPAAAVTVTVTYTGKTDAASVSVTHFGDTVTETLDATLDQGADSQSVTFTADGFSEYGIMLTANATGTELITNVYGTEPLYVEIVNNIASTGKLEAKLYYLDSSSERVYVTDDLGNDYIESFEIDDVTYTVTYTWYQSKKPYLTDSEGKLEDAPSASTEYGYSGQNTNYFKAAVSENYCTVYNGSYNYLFYYYYVSVSVTYVNESGTTKTDKTYNMADEDEPVYATIDGAAEFVEISRDGDTLTATLYVVDDSGEKTKVESSDNFTYTYTWYKSQNYDASSDAKDSDAPDANTLQVQNAYKSYKAVVSNSKSSTLPLYSDDSFYFYYVVVTLTYTDGENNSYVAYAKGYDDAVYAGYVGSTATAAIVDNISSDGTFEAVLYDSDGNIVTDTSNFTYTWYKADNDGDGYLVSSAITSSNLYSDLTKVPDSTAYSVTYSGTENTINIAEDSGGLCYYYVVISDETNTYTYTYSSAAKYVQYSDQIENGSFENGGSSVTTNQNVVPYWTTTNEEYSDNHGYYLGYNPIEIGMYGQSTALSIGAYALAYTKAGNSAGKYFAELNATEASTLYQSVLTEPETTLYWSLYHQSRNAVYKESDQTTTYNNDWDDYNTVYTEDKISALVSNYNTANGTDITCTYGYTTKENSMYVIIMSDSDAELLLAEVDNGYYTSQQAAISVVVTAIKEKTYQENGSSSSENGTIDGCYSGEFTLPSGSKVDVTLWEITTTAVKTIVTLTDSSGNAVDSSVGSAIFTVDDGWATSTASNVTYYYTETEWVRYSGSYTVPTGQYLTRFFFAAVDGGTVANFIDEIQFSKKISYTIDYYVLDLSTGNYVFQKGKTESDEVAYDVNNLETVDAQNLTDFLKAGCVQVGSITSTTLGVATNPTFDTGTTAMATSLDVTPTNNYLTIYLKSSDVALKKVDANTSEVLEGVQFVISTVKTENDENGGTTETTYYYVDGAWTTSLGISSTNESGMIDFGSLDNGTYYIMETKPQDGYNTATGTIEVVVEDGAVESIDFVGGDSSLLSYALVGSETVITLGNTPGVELPETGGVSLPVVYGVGAAMILVSAIGLVVRRKKI